MMAGAGPVPSQKRSASSDSGVSEWLGVDMFEPCAVHSLSRNYCDVTKESLHGHHPHDKFL